MWIGWMNNWDYANFIPTSPWRSAQSVPRGAVDVSSGRVADGVESAGAVAF